MRRLRNKLPILLFIMSLSFIVFNKSNIVSATLPLDDVHGLILVADGYDSGEFSASKDFLDKYGADIDIIGPTAIVSNIFGADIEVDYLIDEFTNFSDYDFLYIPGGMSPGNLVEMPNALSLVVDAYNAGLCLAAICYGPWVFAAADIISGRNISGSYDIESHITGAGANYIPAGIVIDGPFVTGDQDYMYIFAAQGILKGIGRFETDPPEIVNCTVDLISTGEFGSVSITVEVSDYFDSESIIASLYRFDTEQQQYVLALDVPLLSNPENTIYSKIIELAAYGNYSLWIEAEDVLGNNVVYEDVTQFNLENPNRAGLGLIQISLLLLAVVSLITLVRNRKKNR